MSNTFILDDHRTILVPLQRMKHTRADHSIIYQKGSEHIFVLGGMSFKEGSTNAIESLTSCEMYSVKDDQWSEVPPMNHSR